MKWQVEPARGLASILPRHAAIVLIGYVVTDGTKHSFQVGPAHERGLLKGPSVPLGVLGRLKVDTNSCRGVTNGEMLSLDWLLEVARPRYFEIVEKASDENYQLCIGQAAECVC